LMLAYFIISALDLLDSLKSSITAEEREGYVQWIYDCQLPEGGFRGFPGSDFGSRRNDENSTWDPANVPATYFALATLLVLGDNLERVKRRECLEWLTKMQRSDGSFGETLVNDKIEGGMDMRFGYTAMGIRWILRGRACGEVDGVPDVHVEKLVQRIRQSNTYDGGISELPFHESHGGFTFCAISALSLVNRLPNDVERGSLTDGALSGISDLDLTLRWLISRQTTYLDEGDEDTELGDVKDSTIQPILPWVGFNGRCNKIADTCYSWWDAASLALLGRLDLLNLYPAQKYLLDKTQHAIGGFGKQPGDPPDVYHSYLGLAALSLMKYQGLKPIHFAACISYDAVRHLESLPWRRKIWDSPETAP
jgi:geranylgeranyl transferase type-1 subunit beta